MPENPVIAIRLAHPDEGAVLRRLAALDSAGVPDGPLLLALVDGDPVAALSLAGGAVVADPFVATAHIVELLRARAAQLAPHREAGEVPARRRAALRALAPLRRSPDAGGRAA